MYAKTAYYLQVVYSQVGSSSFLKEKYNIFQL